MIVLTKICLSLIYCVRCIVHSLYKKSIDYLFLINNIFNRPSDSISCDKKMPLEGKEWNYWILNSSET